MEETQNQQYKLANENLRRTIRLTRDMLALADEGDRDRLDDSCGILYGLLRDMAYRLRKTAEEECQKHIKSGRWDGGNEG
jgi:hypothetical protein